MSYSDETACCRSCGIRFVRAIDERWKKQCLDCWKQDKAYTSTGRRSGWSGWNTGRKSSSWGRQEASKPPPGWTPPPSGPTKLEQELLERVPQLIRLVHPDKHDGSNVANDNTAWLIKLRDQRK